ncbi:MAG: glycosyltransferase family 39 protein [Candidatus Eremiobacteraeota bacterium]|nr:glycosyltransferase family 39 protein [Candidatus Eremiobacteraeota bacterium]
MQDSPENAAWDSLRESNGCGMQKPARVALLGAAFAAVLTLPGLGSGTLWDNSETAYGEVAREILLFHSAVVMHLDGAAWYVQPPLYFWIAAALAKLFGIGAFAMRLPSALATIAMAGITGYSVTRAAGQRAGLYAAIVLSSSLMQAIIGRLAIMDALLDLCVAVSILCWWRALQTGSERAAYIGWAAAALGFLTKGPVALAIPLLVLVPYFFWTRRHAVMQAPRARTWFIGIAIFLVISIPWLIALASLAGTEPVRQLIVHYTFGRYTGTIENQGGPFWYYLPVLILGFFPWIAFLPAAFAYVLGQARERGVDDGARSLARLAIVWTVMPLLFFSFARTKLPNYIALELPGLAILAALYFDSIALRYRRRSLMISAAAIPVTVLFLGVAIAVFARQNHLAADLHKLYGDLIAVGVALFVGSCGAAVFFLSERSAARAPYLLGAAAFLAIFVLGVIALPDAEQFKPVPRFAQAIDAQRHEEDAVAISGVPGGNALVFYTRPVVRTLAA